MDAWIGDTGGEASKQESLAKGIDAHLKSFREWFSACVWLRAHIM